MSFFIYLYIFALGLCLGSFASALIYRVPRGIPWGLGRGGQPAPRSMCPPCGRTLTVWELIPVFSWVFQRGRCKCGKTRISWVYPVLEVGCGVLAVLLAVLAHGIIIPYK
jgi:prepilin signal peptidase PulO-like enzyme (type II secretory pathway)